MSEPDQKNKTNKVVRNFFNPWLFLGTVISFSLLLRLSYLPQDVPLGLDALSYFSYAVKISQLGQFPVDQNLPNNGWPTFLSIFFYFFHSSSFLDYMQLQRYVSTAISLATIIPVYLVCRRFFATRYALFGAALFAFEPKIITNSFLGITEPAYIFLGTITLLLFLGRRRGFIYAAFATAALFSLIRYEGLFVIVPLSIMFFVRFRKERRFFLRYLLAAFIFVLVLLPMAYIRIQTNGEDGLISHFSAGSTYVSEQVIKGVPDDDYPIMEEDQNKTLHFIFRGLEALGKYLGLLIIPNFVVFGGFGLYFYIKNKKYASLDHNTITIIIFTITLLLPAFYAYMRGIQEIRYLLIILPIFYLLSSYGLKKLDERFGRFSLIVILSLSCMFFASMIYLDVQKIDYQHEKEAYLISGHIVNTPKVINTDPLDGNYITTAQVVKKWPNISSPSEFEVIRIPTAGYNSLEEFIRNSKDRQPTHIVVDGSSTRPSYLQDVFYDDARYPYLIKEYDSTEYGISYHVKVYRIDYKIFETYTNSLDR